MSWAGIAACLWVLASALVALLPRRRQYAPGFVLLAAVPVLIVWMARTYGLWAGLLILIVFLSMFRKPLMYFTKRALGKTPALPRDERGEG